MDLYRLTLAANYEHEKMGNLRGKKNQHVNLYTINAFLKIFDKYQVEDTYKESFNDDEETINPYKERMVRFVCKCLQLFVIDAEECGNIIENEPIPKERKNRLVRKICTQHRYLLNLRQRYNDENELYKDPLDRVRATDLSMRFNKAYRNKKKCL